MVDIKDKIKKLLSLGTSTNENEARSALLKARELMAKHKLSEADLGDIKNAELVTLTCDEITWTTDSGEIWMTDLCRILGDNYCCVSAWRTKKGCRTYVLCITGLKDDAEVCREVIKYAAGFVRGAIFVQSRKSTLDKRTVASSYAKGFIAGLDIALDLQKDEHPEWGLVVQKPEEVKKYEESLSSKSVRSRKADFDPLAYAKGQNDGMRFNAKAVLGWKEGH